MPDEQRVGAPAARHMQKPSLRQRMAATTAEHDAGAAADDTAQHPAPNRVLKRKRRVALAFTVLVALAIPALLLALLLAG